MAVTQLNRQALLASVRHGLAVSADGGRRIPPASAVQPLLLEDVELRLADPGFIFNQYVVVVV